MIVRPKEAPSVVVELSADEAKALVRAIGRAVEPIRAAGNTLDIQRLGTLKDGLEKALGGAAHFERVES